MPLECWRAKLLTIVVNPDSHRISPALPLFVSSDRSFFHIAIGPLSATLQPNATNLGDDWLEKIMNFWKNSKQSFDITFKCN